MKNSLAHIAIAVDSIEKVKPFFELITGGTTSSPKFIESQKVNTSFLPVGGTHLEFLEPVGDSSPISNFMSKRGGGIHHICIESHNFEDLVSQIKALGIRTLGDPFIGAKNRKVVFFHPKDTFNVLIELEEA
ncbi:MAG: VOC family protein [Candidatus Kariarchaeaceae archaeon]|jgi:methylmalonyl-CoA/ethylmalonyl-CoA epimerase